MMGGGGGGWDDKEMFDVDALNGEEVFVAGQNENVVKEVVDAAQVSKSTITTTISSQQSQNKGKGIMIEELVKPMKKKDQITKINDDHQLAERFQAQEQEELSDAEKATLFQQLLERRKHFAAKRVEEKRNKPTTKAQQKNFDSIQEMFDRSFKRVNTFEDFRTELVEGKEKRAGTELIQENTKKQKVEDWKMTKKIAELLKIYMLAEKKYPLAPLTLLMMLEKKLNIDYESEMDFVSLLILIIIIILRSIEVVWKASSDVDEALNEET
ncbi:hypothetical protein Tco_1561904 [Tanacetum coccineum]